MTQDFSPHAPRATRMKKLPLDFEAFHQMYRPRYVCWATSRLGSRADAEEAVDAAFEQLLKAWQTILTTENPAAYAWRVLRNSTIDFSRARDRRPALIGEAAFETVALGQAADPIGQFEESLHLYQAIGQLPPRQMDVILLQFSHGYSVDEVAAALGITPAGVRSTARHAKRRLQHAYGVRRHLENAETVGDLENVGDRADGTALTVNDPAPTEEAAEPRPAPTNDEGHADDVAH
ncbi:sigma-70 family RNA polymerase sigma factor [Streptomyces sp. R21]|uniref:Sigma-70 family RNA polymerase sigma factor n=1 Tax=Streptomyces sp. R21 TaxID=3238627 RepID=A0AB39PCA2_9ACTN